ncbi:hypothetical protein PSYJA_44181, partial [Pseudomonas syringae pv. japonica str. M301072]
DVGEYKVGGEWRVLEVGMTLILIIGGIDLSVGSVLALAASAV